jgi:hypothetical protein
MSDLIFLKDAHWQGLRRTRCPFPANCIEPPKTVINLFDQIFLHQIQLLKFAVSQWGSIHVLDLCNSLICGEIIAFVWEMIQACKNQFFRPTGFCRNHLWQRGVFQTAALATITC